MNRKIACILVGLFFSLIWLRVGANSQIAIASPPDSSAVEQGNRNLEEEESQKRAAAKLVNQTNLFPKHVFKLTEMHYSDFGTRPDGTEWAIFKTVDPREITRKLPPRSVQTSPTEIDIAIERKSADKPWELTLISETYSVMGLIWTNGK